MKRIFAVLMVIAIFAGLALTAGVLSNRVLAAGTPAGTAKTASAGSNLPVAQINVISIPEPASIVLSSLLLLGSTTLLRRRRLTRRA